VCVYVCVCVGVSHLILSVFSMRGALCVYVCVCVCVCVRAAFDFHDFLDTEGVLCV